MRTTLFLLAGFSLLACCTILARLFSSYFPAAATTVLVAFWVLWLALTGFNMWVGVVRAGYSVSEELPIMLMLFGIPAGAALLARWKLM